MHSKAFLCACVTKPEGSGLLYCSARLTKLACWLACSIQLKDIDILTTWCEFLTKKVAASDYVIRQRWQL